MSLHDDEVRLRDMLDYARYAILFVQGRNRDELDTDPMLALALARAVEVVGESARALSAEGRARLPDIPWSLIIGMRNRLVHAYAAVDADILWETAIIYIPILISALETVLPPDKNESQT